MKKLFASSAAALVIAACATPSAPTSEQKAFAPVQAVLERNCVHCHGDQRLATMPAIGDGKALAKLVGPRNFIVPGKPQSSRFFFVVSMPDSVPGVMPPTGHAISKAEVAVLRDWIEKGAAIPEGRSRSIKFVPTGEPPRSR